MFSVFQRRQVANELRSKMEALDKNQAVIEFSLDGTILTANENFLKMLGYTLDEVCGAHHSMFVDPSYASSSQYTQFWSLLRQGQFQASEYKRLGKNNKEIWIQASYNPICDLNGKPFKVIKIATDVTDMVVMRLENEKGIKESMCVLEAIASGDLTQTLKNEYTGNFKNIKTAINQTVDNLIRMIQGIKESVQVINEGVANVSAGSESLACRTEQQASNLQETAASMEQISSTVKITSSNSQEASQLGESSKTLAIDGGDVIQSTVCAMKEIEDSSNKISEITNMIDAIAFQTNLLALNAAVEAARAGDAGKGFAVVAEEVRALAQRASSASKQIKALILSSSQNVQKGVMLSSQAGKSIAQIVEISIKLADVNSQIASASAEQTTGLEQINMAICQLDDVTQENVAMVKESASALTSLDEQVGKLNSLLQGFRLPGQVTFFCDDPKSITLPFNRSKIMGSQNKFH